MIPTIFWTLDLHLLGEFTTWRIARFWRRMTVFVRNTLDGHAPERRMRSPAKGGSGSVENAATAFQGASHPAAGPTFLGKALPRPARSHHSASSRLALQPKNRTLHSVQLPDLELSDVGQGMF
jgi:hypothetical protein